MKYNYDLELKIREAEKMEKESKKNMSRFQ